MTSILIIGSNGFVGLNFLENDTFFDKKFTISRSSLKKTFKKNIISYKFDINDNWLFNEKVDVVLFCATEHQFSSHSPQPIDYVNTNINGLIKSLEFFKKSKPRYFIYLSTMAVYGSPKISIIDENSPVYNPDLYGTSKFLAEKILETYSKFFKILVLRLPGIIGPKMPIDRPWISTIVNKLLHDKEINVYNELCNFNNIIDVENIKNFVQHLWENQFNFKYEIVNLAASCPEKLIDVIKFLKRNLNSKSKIIYFENAEKDSFEIDISKISKKFDFYPETTKELMKKIISYYEN